MRTILASAFTNAVAIRGRFFHQSHLAQDPAGLDGFHHPAADHELDGAGQHDQHVALLAALAEQCAARGVPLGFRVLVKEVDFYAGGFGAWLN